MIDTHIWVWWVFGSTDLQPWMAAALLENEEESIGVSAISCWEIARLASASKLDLGRSATDWLSFALDYPGVKLIDLSPEISVEANYLPEPFHRDPSDRIIVATARILDCELLTADKDILSYPGVKLVRPKP